MKHYEEAVLEVLLVENAVIVTSGGCTGANSSAHYKGEDAVGGFKYYKYDTEDDMWLAAPV